MIRRCLAGLKNPTLWVLFALTAIPFVISMLPGWPTHGHAWIWAGVPLWFWFRRPEHRRRLLLYLLGILVQTLAYPDFDWGFLGWVLLLPYLMARERDDGASWWRAAFFYGFLRACAGFYWLSYVHYSAWLTVAVLSGLAFAFVFEFGLRRLKAFPYALRVATAWVAFEAVHAWAFQGFPWLFLSHTQYRSPAVIQAADLVGAYGISFLVALVQAAGLRALRQLRITKEAIAAGLVLSAALFYGALRGPPESTGPGPGVLMIQTKVPHSVKQELLAERLGQEEMWRSHFRQTRDAMKEYPDARLIIWPETMSPFPYLLGEKRRGHFLGNARVVARMFELPVIYGINTYAGMDRLHRGFNSAALVDRSGQVKGVYRKQRLVPMGEEFVARWVVSEQTGDRWFGWISNNLGIPRSCDLERGKGFVTLDAGPGLRCAMLICFEGLYADLARGAVQEGDADMLVLLVNNGWFANSFEQRQFVASCVFRAVETRTPLLTCANTGITCAVAPSGEILGEVDRVMEEGVLYTEVPPRWDPPVFLRGGAYALAVLLAVAFGIAFLLARIGKRRFGTE